MAIQCDMLNLRSTTAPLCAVDVDPLVDVSVIPGIDLLIEGAVRKVVKGLLVLPNKLQFNLAEMLFPDVEVWGIAFSVFHRSYACVCLCIRICRIHIHIYI